MNAANPRRVARALTLLACTLSFASTASAQRMTSPRFPVVGIADSSPYVAAHARRAFTPAMRASILHGGAPRSVARQRAAHAGYGAIIGAVVGGALGFVADRRDHTGEGMTAPVMIGAGAIAGAIPGALTGLLLPVRHEPTN